MTDVFSVSSLEEYIKIVERFSPNFSLSRGQGSDLPLFPSALRRDQDGMRLYSKTTIQSFLEDFKFNSQMYIEGASTYHENDWLIHAQHFGVPTCLLDFTYSHLVSLMFALEKAFDYDQDDEDNAVVWLLDPEALNLKTNKGSVYHEPYVAVRLPFRVAAEMPTCFEAIHPAYLPYVHQQKAFERLTGDDGRSTLVATGTGSGKTECFLYPILEYCYQHRGERGIKALIIYPMNALATDQAKRIAELIYGSDELRGNVTVGMYVGGQEHTPARTMSEHGVITDHETMLNNAPDILMTNYKMLDYLLVRPKDALLWQDNNSETLKYIAVDELHTFDGAQGTDLACLLRRLKRRFHSW